MNKLIQHGRRKFLLAGATAGASFLGLSSGLAAAQVEGSRALKVLFLGGTGFIGPHMVRACLDAGLEVTLFNRGKRNADLFPGLETIIGNRDPEKDAGLSGLKNRRWDVVVDTSGYIPRHVNASAELLANSATHYVFISTVSVYADFSKPGMDESAPLIVLDDPTVEDVTGATYGGLKVLCEQAVAKHFDGANTILRPTYIVGPGDHTDRFIHYIHRPMQGGRMAMPGVPENAVDYVDVRDLAAFTARAASEKVLGTFNMVSAPGAANFGQLIDMSVNLSESDVEITWLDSDFLTEQQAKLGDDYVSFPMWHDQFSDADRATGLLSQERAVKAGFKNRPFSETVKATHQWWSEQPEERKTNRRIIISDEYEKALLKAWDNRA